MDEMILLLFCVPFEGFFANSCVFRLLGEFLGEESVFLGFVEVFSPVSRLGLEIIIFRLTIEIGSVDVGFGFLGGKESGLGEAHFNLGPCGRQTTGPKDEKE